MKDYREKYSGLLGTLDQLVAAAISIAEEHRTSVGERRWREPACTTNVCKFGIRVWGHKPNGASTRAGEVRAIQTPKGLEISVFASDEHWLAVKESWEIMVRGLTEAGFFPSVEQSPKPHNTTHVPLPPPGNYTLQSIDPLMRVGGAVVPSASSVLAATPPQPMDFQATTYKATESASAGQDENGQDARYFHTDKYPQKVVQAIDTLLGLEETGKMGTTRNFEIAIPKRPKELQDWRDIWRLVRADVEQGKPMSDIKARLLKRPDLSVGDRRLEKIIVAGRAGLLHGR